MNYSKLFSRNLPEPVEMPAGLTAEAKYVFSVTYADPDVFSADKFADSVRDSLRDESRDLAMYPPPQGHLGMRELIARDLEKKRGVETGPDSIFLSGGAGGAIQVIRDAFIDPGDIVLVEEFTYLGTLKALLERRAQVVHIPTDQEGMDTDALESTVRDLISQGKRPKLIYTISVYQNPMGMTLSLERRKRMLEISQEFGIPIVENESYADFRIDGPPLPPAMAGMDAGAGVMYVSAYTKLLGCGLRLGYAVVPDPVRDTLAKLRFGGSPSHLSAMAVHRYLRDHGDEHIRAVSESLRLKRDAMLSALGENFPPVCTWDRPEGGMMIWVRLPEGADTWSALDKAVEAGVKYNPGPIFRAARDRKNYLRLTYSHNTPEEIGEGISILADVFQREGLFDSKQ
jgi:2-aminoadipate transaminase